MSGMSGFLKFVCILTLLVIAGVARVKAAGACGKSSPDQLALQLAPCAEAARNPKAPVSGRCCLQVKGIGWNPKCLCAVLLSRTSKASGLNLKVAISIPKRCNFARRPVGYKCGPYTFP